MHALEERTRNEQENYMLRDTVKYKAIQDFPSNT